MMRKLTGILLITALPLVNCGEEDEPTPSSIPNNRINVPDLRNGADGTQDRDASSGDQTGFTAIQSEIAGEVVFDVMNQALNQSVQGPGNSISTLRSGQSLDDELSFDFTEKCPGGVGTVEVKSTASSELSTTTATISVVYKDCVIVIECTEAGEDEIFKIDGGLKALVKISFIDSSGLGEFNSEVTVVGSMSIENGGLKGQCDMDYSLTAIDGEEIRTGTLCGQEISETDPDSELVDLCAF